MHARKRGPLAKAVGRVIREIRIERGLTMEKLAERLDLYNGETVRKTEVHGCGSVEAITRYADALGTTPMEIVRRGIERAR